MVRVITVNDVLDGHVVLDIECLDRVYLNAYVPCGVPILRHSVDLRRLEPADVLVSRAHSLLLRASGITDGVQANHRGYMNGQYEDHGRLRARRGGSYGPYPPLERLTRGDHQTVVNQLHGCRDDPPAVV